MRTAADLLEELNAVDESVAIDAKRASEVGKSALQTISAFCNEPGLGGGYLLLGVEWKINEVGDRVYCPAGLDDPDKIQSDLATQCASMFNRVIRPDIRVERVDGKPVLVVFVPEVDTAAKPIFLKATGLPRGAWRRIGPTDQRCNEEDLWVLRGTDEPRQSYDGAVMTDARLDDLDPQVVAEYRRMRERVNPTAEELQYGDEDLLEALHAIKRTAEGMKPTVAGILLFGKALALRRLFPAMRIDYIRIDGTYWVEDPDRRFQTQDIRKPLLLALRQAEAAIVDDLPKGFQLPEGALQSEQEPILSRKVIRESLANAVMHRNYRTNEPIQIIRYSNRLEVGNPGYSLKNPADLGRPGSRQRNPFIAAVLHDLNLAETKGSGIRTMRQLAAEAGLAPPEFVSDRAGDSFRAVLYLHHLLKEEDLAWLRTIYPEKLPADAEKVLIYARETGAVDNTSCRELTGLDTLQASALLRRLRQMALLEKQAGGNRTYYTLADESDKAPTLWDFASGAPDGKPTNLGEKPPNLGEKPPNLSEKPPNLGEKPPNLSEKPPNLGEKPPKVMSPELAAQVKALAGRRVSTDKVKGLLLALCSSRAYSIDELVSLLEKNRDYVMHAFIRPMVRKKELAMRYPESPNHPYQAYIVPKKEKSD